ncbi:MAG: EAL domain-containing protein [Thermaerobacterales bacterium]
MPFDRVLAQINQAVIATDLDGFITYCNEFSETLFGWRPAEVLGKQVLDIAVPGVQKELAHQIMIQLSEGKEWAGSLTVMRSTGDTFPIGLTAAPLRDEQGVIIGILGIARDITEHELVKLELAESQERLRVAAAALGMWEWDIATDRLTCTSDFTNEVGIPDLPAAGTDSQTATTLTEAMEMVHPDDRNQASQALHQAMDQGSFSDLELRVMLPDDTTRWLSVRGETIRLPDGRPERLVGTIMDITDRKITSDQLHESERFVRNTLDALSTHIAILDEHGTILAVNAAWRGFARLNPPLNSSVNEGVNYLDVCDRARGKDAADAQAFARGIRDVIAGRRSSFSREYACHSPHTKRWFVGRVTRFANDGPVRLVVSHENITGRKRIEEELHRKAYYDALTDLPNRALFLTRLESALATAKTEHSLAVLFLDLDNFKDVNDRFGHIVGDQLLVEVGRRLRHCVKEQDTVARLSGDEFAMLLNHIDDPGYASRVAERVSQRLRVPFFVGNQHLHVTTSIGIITNDSNYATPDDVIRFADVALYHVKRHGKDSHKVFEPAMNVFTRDRLELEEELKTAVEEEALQIAYQPIIALGQAQNSSRPSMKGVEVLARWYHPRRGPVAPTEFIPLAEESGLIFILGNQIMRRACYQMQEWIREMGTEAPGYISINLSARQFHSLQMVEDLQRVLIETGIEPHRVQLEIGENATLHAGDIVLETLLAFKKLGVRVALDDYGRGYSSLRDLKRLPIDEIKIDRSLVQHIEHRAGDRATLQAVLMLASSLRMNTVAEGVETPGQAEILNAIGCDDAQGYYFSWPLQDRDLRAQMVNKDSKLIPSRPPAPQTPIEPAPTQTQID